MSQPSLIIFGGGGHGKTIIDLVRAAGVYHLAGIVDDVLPPGSNVLGAPVLGGSAVLPDLLKQGIHLAVNAVGGIGNVDARMGVFTLLQKAGFEFPAVVHPSAVIDASAQLAPGVQVLALSYVCADSRIGFGTLLNAGAIVSHDANIGQVVNLSPGATLAGRVTIEDYAQIGMRVTINMDITIGRRARVGNGATVKADVPPETVVRAGTIWPIRVQGG